MDWDYLVDDHVWYSDVHLFSDFYLRAVEVCQLFFEYGLHRINSWIYSSLYESVMNLSYVYLVDDLICCQSAKAALFLLTSLKFFAMWWRIGDVENVSKSGSPRQINPA